MACREPRPRLRRRSRDRADDQLGRRCAGSGCGDQVPAGRRAELGADPRHDGARRSRPSPAKQHETANQYDDDPRHGRDRHGRSKQLDDILCGRRDRWRVRGAVRPVGHPLGGKKIAPTDGWLDDPIRRCRRPGQCGAEDRWHLRHQPGAGPLFPEPRLSLLALGTDQIYLADGAKAMLAAMK